MAEGCSMNHLGGRVWPYHAAFRILVPQPGIKPGPLTVKVQSLNHLDHQGSKSLGSSSCLTVFCPASPWNMLSRRLPVPIVSDEESIVNPLGSPFVWFFSCSFKVFSLSFSIFPVMCLGQDLFALCSFCLESTELRFLCLSSNLGSFQLFKKIFFLLLLPFWYFQYMYVDELMVSHISLRPYSFLLLS